MAASTGTLIAAALESLGYRAQAEILQTLGPMILDLGALAFIIAILMVVIAFGITGNLMLVRWLLVGPGLFYFLVFTPVDSVGAEWQFGAEVAERADGRTNAQDLNDVLGETQTVTVSWAFDRFNQLVSSLSRELISVITNRQSVIKEIKFTARQRALDGVLASQTEDSGLRALVEIGLKSECGEAMQLMRTLAYGRRDPFFQNTAEWKDARDRYEDLFIKRTFSLAPNSPEYEYLRDHLRAIKLEGREREYMDQYCETSSTDRYRYLYDDFGIVPEEDQSFFSNIAEEIGSWFSGGSGDISQFSPELLLSRGVNCQRLWCWTMMAFRHEAETIKNRIDKAVIPNRASDELKLEIWQEVSLKLQDPNSEVAIRGDLSVVPTVIAGVLQRKQFVDNVHSKFMTTFAKWSGYRVEDYNYGENNDRNIQDDVARRRNQSVQAAGLRFEVYQMAMSLPYFQGLLLYLLAIAYPFFCLLMILPGKGSFILNWMALWLWVKSWDVGWALSMVVDDTIWRMMPHRAFHNVLQDPLNSPLTVMESAFRPDPAYSLSTYYMILGVLVMSVPVYCGHFVLGAKKAILGTLLTGFNRLGTNLGNFYSNQRASFQAQQSEILRDFHASSYMLNQVNSGNMPPELKAEWDRANSLATNAISATGTVIGGTVMAVGSIPAGVGNWINDNMVAPVGDALGHIPLVGGVLKGATNMLGSAGAGLMSIPYSAGESLYRPALGMSQDAARYRVQVYRMNAAYHYYRGYRTNKVQTALATYAADSNRGEWFSLPAPQNDMLADYHRYHTWYTGRQVRHATTAATGTVFNAVGGKVVVGGIKGLFKGFTR